ncbi:hypothetical protein KQX54_000365 [Cotesia glomerata]|uniref:Uncharacterized protein n=1 Tax=Cotesia glomerata TaxID=32391 RepID=A0AAV7ITU2_COTGL|nr:hypothetical protein KQX54_000365 [Cotesia glomerata]
MHSDTYPEQEFAEERSCTSVSQQIIDYENKQNSIYLIWNYFARLHYENTGRKEREMPQSQHVTRQSSIWR